MTICPIDKNLSGEQLAQLLQQTDIPSGVTHISLSISSTQVNNMRPILAQALTMMLRQQITVELVANGTPHTGFQEERSLYEI